jgi:hypothetical protein
MAYFFIQPQTPRPDFRLVITFLWNDSQDVDTDGNAHNPASREWTELYCLNRDRPQETFDVEPVSNEPLTLRIASRNCELAARVAYYLAIETKSLVSSSQIGPWYPPECLTKQLGTFDLHEATNRVAKSRWRETTLDHPYP